MNFLWRDFKFELQRFAITAIVGNETVTVEGVLPANPQAGKYYFQANSSVGTTFSDITIKAALDDDLTADYFVINSVTGIALPGGAVSGKITTGSNVGYSVEDAVPISGLGSSTLTFGGLSLAFTNANADAAVNIYGGNHIAQVGLEKGSFKIAAKNGAIKINAPSGKGQVTIGGAALNYSTSSQATIGVEQSSVTSFNIHDVGDKLTVTSALAKNENFFVTDGDLEISYALPTMSAYTVEKVENGYLTTGMANIVSVEGEGIYKITNNSGNVALVLNKYGDLSGIVLNTNDSIVVASSDDDLAGIDGTELKLYSGSFRTVVSKTASGLTISNLMADDEIVLNGVIFFTRTKAAMPL